MRLINVSGSIVITNLECSPQHEWTLHSTLSRDTWQPAALRANLPGVAFHALRHSFVAILVAAGCNVREVSEWAGHDSAAFTLTRYGGLFDEGTVNAVSRLDDLLS